MLENDKFPNTWKIVEGSKVLYQTRSSKPNFIYECQTIKIVTTTKIHMLGCIFETNLFECLKTAPVHDKLLKIALKKARNSIFIDNNIFYKYPKYFD